MLSTLESVEIVEDERLGVHLVAARQALEVFVAAGPLDGVARPSVADDAVPVDRLSGHPAGPLRRALPRYPTFSSSTDRATGFGASCGAVAGSRVSPSLTGAAL